MHSKIITANRICQMCDRPFYAKPAHIAAGIAKFCSNRCRSFGAQVPLAIPDSEVDLIYMAGIVDGEGTITIGTTGSPRVLIGNSSLVLMDWLIATFGGRCSTQRRQLKPVHKPVSMWYIGSEQSVALCQLLLPYLKLKRRQAEIVAAFYSSPDKAALIDEIRLLNYRGISV